MYAGNYGFPNGAPPSQNPQMQGQGPNPNQSPQQPQQQQQQQQPQQQQPQQQQQQQHMMYNPQQFPMGAPGGAFPGGPNVNMMSGAGPAAGMMQSAGMPHMAAANGQMPNYQAGYPNNPYGAGVPTSVAPQMNMPPNYAMGGGMPMGGFQMHPGQMTPQQQQQMMQRMQHQQQQQQQQQQPNAGGMPSNTPQRQFPGQGQAPVPQSTPTPNNSLPSQQPQFSAPQAPHPSHQNQTPNSAHQQQQQHQPQHQPLGSNIQTPQTPTFPSNVQGAVPNGNSNAVPLSPGAESREKERIAVLLEINSELLWEATQVQNTMLAVKNEKPPPANGAANDTEKTEEEKLLMQDFTHCMRRLQGNLAYLAHLADNKKAASGQAAPAHPSYMKPPPLSPKVRIRAAPPTEGVEGKAVEPGNRDDTIKYFNDLYTRLQHLYPGVDYNKEPALPPPGARPGPQGPNAHKQMPSQSNISVASPVPGKQATPKMAASGPPQMPPQMQQQMPQQMPLGQPTMNGPAA